MGHADNYLVEIGNDDLVGGTLEKDWGLMAMAQLKSEILKDSAGY
jgi:hypothetical protein